jgi:PAS domain S-box-containing protein
MKISIKVLIMADTKYDVKSTVMAIEQAGFSVRYHYIDNPNDLNIALKRKWDILLAEYNIPGFNAFEVQKIAKKTNPDLPLILMTETMDENTAVEMMSSGARDFVFKQDLKRLGAIVLREYRSAEINRERVRAENALRQSERYFESLFEGTGEAIYVLDYDGEHILNCNKQATIDLGYTKSEILRLSAPDIDANYNKREIIEIHNRIKPGKSLIIESRHKRKDGSTFPVELRLGILKIRREEQIISSVRNVTIREQAEKELIFQAELLNSATDSIIVFDTEKKILYANETACHSLGYTKEELLGQNLSFILSPEYLSRVADRDKELQQKGEATFESADIRKDGTRMPVEVHGKLIEVDGKWHMAAIMRDITERQRGEDILRKSEVNFRHSLESLPLGVMIQDIKGETLFINQALLDITGYQTQKELVSVSLDKHFTHESYQLLVERTAKIKQNESVLSQFELDAVRKDGTIRHLSVSRIEVVWNGQTSFQTIFQDITERKENEILLKNSQRELRDLYLRLQNLREEERTRIAGELHDELGQVMTALKMDLSWLAKKLPKENLTLLGKIAAMSELTDVTANTIRRISTELRPGLLDDLGLPAAIEWQTDEFAKRCDIRCEITLPDREVIIEKAKATAIFRIFQELLTNINRHSRATVVKISLHAKQNIVELSVKDNGVGISKEAVKSSKSLGLLGIRERVTAFDGWVIINGQPGKGTIVDVKMPL